MIAYFIRDRVRCLWIKVVTSLAVWRSIPRAVGISVCRGAPLAILGLTAAGPAALDGLAPPAAVTEIATPSIQTAPEPGIQTTPMPAVQTTPMPAMNRDNRPALLIFRDQGALSGPSIAASLALFGPGVPLTAGVGTKMPPFLDRGTGQDGDDRKTTAFTDFHDKNFTGSGPGIDHEIPLGLTPLGLTPLGLVTPRVSLPVARYVRKSGRSRKRAARAHERGRFSFNQRSFGVCISGEMTPPTYASTS